jgi:hypothetical protein
MVRRAAETLQPAIRAASVIAAALLLFLAAGAFAQDGPIKQAADRMEQIRAQLDRIEAAAGQPDRASQPLRRTASNRTASNRTARNRRKAGAGPRPNRGPAQGTRRTAVRRCTAGGARRRIRARTTIECIARCGCRAASGAPADGAGGQIVENIDRSGGQPLRSIVRAQRKRFPARRSGWPRLGRAEPNRPPASLFTHWYEHIVNRVGVALFALALLLSVAAAVAILALRSAVRKRIGAAAPPPPGGEIPLLPQSHKAVLAARDALLDALTARLASPRGP